METVGDGTKARGYRHPAMAVAVDFGLAEKGLGQSGSTASQSRLAIGRDPGLGWTQCRWVY
ncbi:MAG: hypothetical protein WBF25_13690, partial [Terriglobales bacterium]